jgi:hypothetical protein
MEQLTSQLFGLESRHLINCSQMERSAYSRMLYFFITLLMVLSLSIYYFFYLLLQSYWWAIIPTVLLSFVFFSLVRFILITIQLPIGEVVTIKKVLFNGATVFRVVLFALLVFTFVVPLAAFFFRTSINTELDNYKTSLLDEFIGSKNLMLNQQLQSIDTLVALQKAEQMNVAVSDNSSAIKEFKINAINKKIKILNNERQRKAVEYRKIYDQQIEEYSVNLVEAGMPFKRFELLLQQKQSIAIILLFFLPIFLILPLFIYLKCSPKYSYSKLFSEEMIAQITHQYGETKKICEQELRQRFNFIKSENPNFLDPPFNRIPAKPAPTKLGNQNLFNFLDANS